MGEFSIPVRDDTTERQKNFKMYFFGRYVQNMAKIRQNNQFRQAGFALTNLTKIRQNREIHKHSLGLTRFR